MASILGGACDNEADGLATLHKEGIEMIQLDINGVSLKVGSDRIMVIEGRRDKSGHVMRVGNKTEVENFIEALERMKKYVREDNLV